MNQNFKDYLIVAWFVVLGVAIFFGSMVGAMYLAQAATVAAKHALGLP